ncbi:MAG TPA: HD domain-containing phosphohydrolase [Gemmatimonadaceae bacterium]|nr:HD domain-containing phosphohydrolase [Gemmatimonadaceae bacterium]
MTRILIVDDEETIRLALRKFLRSRGYEVEIAGSGDQALELLDHESFSLMLCDVRMPGMTGVQVVPQARSRDEDLAIIMLTAVNDAATATEVLSAGASDYLMKPVELADLQQAVDRALLKRTELMEKRRVDKLIREEVALRTAELEREKESLRLLSIGIAETLINAMEAKDVYLRGHSQRVAELAGQLAQELGLEDAICEDLRVAGRLHDVGKIGIREAILNKPGSLTSEEFEHVKQHVRIGLEILEPLFHIRQPLKYIEHHHEHWNGAGYPLGLAGPEIPLGARILCAADTFDALTSKRAYREPLEPMAALEHLHVDVGTQFDPRVYEALVRVIERRMAARSSASARR